MEEEKTLSMHNVHLLVLFIILFIKFEQYPSNFGWFTDINHKQYKTDMI